MSERELIEGAVETALGLREEKRKLQINYAVFGFALVNPSGGIQPFYSKTYGVQLPTIIESREKAEMFIGERERQQGWRIRPVKLVFLDEEPKS